MKKLFRYDYISVNGKLERIKTEHIYAWVPINILTGEVELDDVRKFDDDLEPLSEGWEWRKVSIKEGDGKGEG